MAAHSKARILRASASVPPPVSPSMLTTAAFEASSAPRFAGMAADATLPSRAKVSIVSPSIRPTGAPMAQKTIQISIVITK